MYHSLKTKKKIKTKKSAILNTFNGDDYSCDFLSPIKKIKRKINNLRETEIFSRRYFAWKHRKFRL